jgi:hypothetical protein
MESVIQPVECVDVLLVFPSHLLLRALTLQGVKKMQSAAAYHRAEATFQEQEAGAAQLAICTLEEKKFIHIECSENAGFWSNA